MKKEKIPRAPLRIPLRERLEAIGYFSLTMSSTIGAITFAMSKGILHPVVVICGLCITLMEAARAKASLRNSMKEWRTYPIPPVLQDMATRIFKTAGSSSKPDVRAAQDSDFLYNAGINLFLKNQDDSSYTITVGEGLIHLLPYNSMATVLSHETGHMVYAEKEYGVFNQTMAYNSSLQNFLILVNILTLNAPGVALFIASKIAGHMFETQCERVDERVADHIAVQLFPDISAHRQAFASMTRNAPPEKFEKILDALFAVHDPIPRRLERLTKSFNEVAKVTSEQQRDEAIRYVLGTAENAKSYASMAEAFNAKHDIAFAEMIADIFDEEEIAFIFGNDEDSSTSLVLHHTPTALKDRTPQGPC